MDLIQRPRRLRGSETLRKMVRETRIDKSSLIYPLFVKEGTGIAYHFPHHRYLIVFNNLICHFCSPFYIF